MDAFTTLTRKAHDNRWCVRPGCTTCGSREYRAALAELAGDSGAGLLRALLGVDFEELCGVPDWDDALVLALYDLPLPGQCDQVLDSWLARPGLGVRVIDVILFRILRRQGGQPGVRGAWIDRGLAEAMVSGDPSLIETLLLVMGPEARDCADLIDAAKRIASTSPQMRRVLRNACGVETLAGGQG